MTQSPAYINTKKVVEHTAANSLGNINIYTLGRLRMFLLRGILFFSPDTLY